MPAHDAHGEESPAALEGPGGLGLLGQAARERRESSLEIAFGGNQQPAAAKDTFHCQWAAQAPRMQVVGLEVGTGLLELTEGDQRLDRIRPHGLRRIQDFTGEQSLR